jgi:IclR family acetate operon transcriptional repressor
MARLRDATGETIHLVVPDVPDLVVVARVDGTNSLRTFLPLGTHAPLFATATGRALLSAMTDEQVADVLDMGLKRYTESTLVDRREVVRAIEQARERGYAVNSAEWRAETAAIGVPIVSRAGAPVAAVAVSMPRTKYEEADLPALADLVMAAGRRIADQLQDWQQGDTWIG